MLLLVPGHHFFCLMKRLNKRVFLILCLNMSIVLVLLVVKMYIVSQLTSKQDPCCNGRLQYGKYHQKSTIRGLAAI